MRNELLCIAAAAAIGAAWLLTPAQTHAARGRNFNINISGGDAESCAALRASTDDDGRLAQVSEQFTLRRSEAPVLGLNAASRGHVTVRGWDRGEFSVETCKIAAAESDAAAGQMVRGISVSHSGGRLSFDGPTTDNGEWLVYFIVHAPKDAAVDLETRNGPISVRDLNGNLKLRAVNGPIAIRDCGGNVEAHTTNGPIAFTGNGGDVHLTAQNGPISLSLANDTWNGNQLEARTINGPLSLAVPDTFLSGVRVETSGHTPMSCSVSACRNAFTDATANNRVLQMNGSSGTIRISTENGPVSIHASKKAKGTVI